MHGYDKEGRPDQHPKRRGSVTSTMSRPSVDVTPLSESPAAVALFCHGGTADSTTPPSDGALSLLRMRAIQHAVRDRLEEQGIEPWLLRYRFAGWNGSRADAAHDTRWALDEVSRRHGDIPVVLVGHSMGGRAAIRAAGHPAVRAVCALAPWVPPNDPVSQLRGKTLVIAHGRGDRWVPARGSLEFALRAKHVAPQTARFTLPGGHSLLRRAHAWHELVREVVSAGLGFEPFGPTLTNAFQQEPPAGLTAPL
jgi:pimeloyl-ACP methyl ester carboxylesterase